MIFYSQNKKKRLYGVVLLILCAFILALTAPTAKASNNYISNVSFYKEDSNLYFRFLVNTSFTMGAGCGNTGKFNNNAQQVFVLAGSPQNYISPAINCYDAQCGGSWRKCDFVAGNTYTVNTRAFYRSGTGSSYSLAYYTSQMGSPITSHFAQFMYSPISDYEYYYFSEFPTLDIYYPLPNDEIYGAFDMTGLYTLPAGSPYDTLLAMVNEPGISDVTYYGFFQMNLPPEWWDVVIRVAGVPAGEYEIFFAFIDYDDPDNIYIPSVSIPITIVVGSPSEFEPGEIPPSMFNILDPDSYYTANSNYASSTLVFDNLSGAVKPVILKIGDYLVFFSSKFDVDIAKETGEAMAGGVLIVRAYADNLNTFFGDLPISQALFFYLLLLVVVAVFRIVRNLINLIKP